MNLRKLSIWKSILSREEWVDLKLSVGTHSRIRRLSPVGVAKLLIRLRDAGVSTKWITKEIQIDSSIVSRFLLLDGLPSKFVDLVAWGQHKEKISFTQAAFAMKVETVSDTDRLFLLKKVLEEGLNKQELQNIRELQSRTELNIEQLINETLNDRPIVLKRNLMIGFIEGDVKPILNTMEPDTIDLEFIKLLKDVFPLVEFYSAKITINRFTLTTDEFGQRQIELKARKENVNYNTLIMANIRKMWGDT